MEKKVTKNFHYISKLVHCMVAALGDWMPLNYESFLQVDISIRVSFSSPPPFFEENSIDTKRTIVAIL